MFGQVVAALAVVWVTLTGSGAEPVPVPDMDSSSTRYYQWSPDGRYMVYGLSGDLWLWDSARREARNLTATPDRWELMPAWAPSGDRLAFASRPLDPREGRPAGKPWNSMHGCFCGNPTVIGVDGTGYRVLEEVTVSNPPSWAPDGAALVYDGLRLYDFVSGRGRDLRVALPGLKHVSAPSWAPTGAAEVAFFFSENDREPSRVRQGYAVVEVRTGKARVLYEYRAPFSPRPPALWAADGKRLAFSLQCALYLCDPIGVFVVDREGGPVEKVWDDAYAIAWEPRGERLAVLENETRRKIHLLRPVDGAWERDLLELPNLVEGIAWRR